MNPASPASPSTQTVLAALERALAERKALNENPVAKSPLFPYKAAIAALVKEGASASFIAETLTAAGLETNPTTVNRFIELAKLRRAKRRAGKGSKPAVRSRP
jgi:hypothetical protein